MSSLNSLNHHFSISGQLAFEETANGMQVVKINNSHASATIALQGAHVMTFQPHDQEAPVLWMSEQAKLEPGKSIRGGVPICWPWFGAHSREASFPAHGFARTMNWGVIASETLTDGRTRISFELQKNDVARAQWPYICHLRCIITVGKTLSIELATENTGDTAFEISEALHTYFNVGDIEHIRIIGLENCAYWDKVTDTRGTQSGSIEIHEEYDRVYLDTAADCIIEDTQLKRRIRIAKRGSLSTVVWNPWTEKSTRMGNMGEEGYRSMVCVESGNALENKISVAPGETHRLLVEYGIESP